MVNVIAYGFCLHKKRNYISVSNHPEGAVLHSKGDQCGESRDISFLLPSHRPKHWYTLYTLYYIKVRHRKYTMFRFFFGRFYFPIIYSVKKVLTLLSYSNNHFRAGTMQPRNVILSNVPVLFSDSLLLSTFRAKTHVWILFYATSGKQRTILFLMYIYTYIYTSMYPDSQYLTWLVYVCSIFQRLVNRRLQPILRCLI